MGPIFRETKLEQNLPLVEKAHSAIESYKSKNYGEDPGALLVGVKVFEALAYEMIKRSHYDSIFGIFSISLNGFPVISLLIDTEGESDRVLALNSRSGKAFLDTLPELEFISPFARYRQEAD